MDMHKLSKLIIQCDELKDIPAIIILRVAVSVVNLINSGEILKELDSCM